MPLTGSDSCSILVEDEAFLVTCGDDVPELIECEGSAAPIEGSEQFVNGDPTSAIEVQSDLLRLMAQNQAEEFAYLSCFLVRHALGRLHTHNSKLKPRFLSFSYLSASNL